MNLGVDGAPDCRHLGSPASERVKGVVEILANAVTGQSACFQ